MQKSLCNVMGIIFRWKKCCYLLEIGILRNSSQKILGVTCKVVFEGFDVQMAPKRPAG